MHWGDLPLEQFGQWPMLVKVNVLLGMSFLIIAMGYWLIIQDSWATYAGLKVQEEALKINFEQKQQQILNVVEYRYQLDLIKERVTAMINNLPVKDELPDLLEEISNAGMDSGLKVTLFMPLSESVHDFYVTLPIKISVQGNYVQLTTFIKQIAKMNRLVTLHELSIKRLFSKKHKMILDDQLVMCITVKIYRQRTS